MFLPLRLNVNETKYAEVLNDLNQVVANFL